MGSSAGRFAPIFRVLEGRRLLCASWEALPLSILQPTERFGHREEPQGAGYFHRAAAEADVLFRGGGKVHGVRVDDEG